MLYFSPSLFNSREEILVTTHNQVQQWTEAELRFSMKVRVNLVFGSSKHLKKYDKVFSGRIQRRTGQIFKGILWEIYDHCAEVLLHIEVGSLVQFGAVKIIKNGHKLTEKSMYFEYL